MADTTNIEWCDSTFNPWIGCTKVSPACDDCYAARSTPARTLGVAWGAGEQRHRTAEASWRQPKTWQRFALDFQYRHGRRRRVFCASLADWLDNEVPIRWLVDLLDLVRATPDLDWLLLTKRIGNWSSRISEAIGYLDAQSQDAYPLPLRAWLCHWLDGAEAPRNVWMGGTVVNQAEVDRDVPKLLRVPAAVRFLSVEPMLGPISFEGLFAERGRINDGTNALEALSWVICGGESGPKARPMHPDWARSLRDQCAAAGVPFLFKQHGQWVCTSTEPIHPEAVRLPGNLCHIETPGRPDRYSAVSHDGRARYRIERIGKKAAGRQLDGRTHDDWPDQGPAVGRPTASNLSGTPTPEL